MWASPTRPGRPGRPSQTDPAAGTDRVAAGSLHPVSGEAVHDRPAANARAALGFPELPHIEPGAGDHPARRSRPEHGRRRRPPDAAEPALGGDRPQRRRAQLSRSRSARKAGPSGSSLPTCRSPRRHSPGIRPRFPRGRIGSSCWPAIDRPTARTRPSSRDRESVTFIVDHDPPAVKVTPLKSGAAIVLKDELTRLVKADYALDGGHWVPIFPDDGLFDTPRENDHAFTSRLEARGALADGSRHRFGRQSRHG